MTYDRTPRWASSMAAVGAAALILAGSPASAQDDGPLRDDRVDGGYQTWVNAWDGGAGHTVVALKLAPGPDGRSVRICAAYGWVGDRLELDDLSQRYMERAVLYADDVKLKNSLGFAKGYATVALDGVAAACREARGDWDPAYRDARLRLEGPSAVEFE